MEITAKKTLRNSQRLRYGLARFLGVAVLIVVLLAGCVMPDGTVYTLPSTLDSTTAEPAAAASETPDMEQSGADEASPAEPYLLAGDEALAANDLETALAEFTRAIEADRDASYGWYRLASVLGYYGELEAALDDANRAIALSPNDPYYHELRGQIRSAMGDLDGAVAD